MLTPSGSSANYYLLQWQYQRSLQSQVTIRKIQAMMKKFETLQELSKCDTETQNEQMSGKLGKQIC